MDLIKIIIMVTWFGISVHQGTGGGNDIFMAGKRRCITNGSSALALVKKIKTYDAERDNKLSSFYPTSEKVCDFEEDSKCIESDLWKVDDWFTSRAVDGPINHYVTDRRWEAFPVYKSYSSQNPTRVLSIESKTFKIPLSVRIQRDGYAQILLCNKPTLRTSYCYYIQLAETQSCVGKFKRKPNYRQILKDACQKVYEPQQEVNGEIVDEDVWTHFIIARSENVIKVFRGNEEFMTYYDDVDDTPETDSMLIHSEKYGLWKVHDYRYLLSEKAEHLNSLQIGPKIRVTKNMTCISMFVAMCQNCCLLLTIELDFSVSITKEISSENGMWKEEKIKFDTQNYIGYEFVIQQYRSTSGPEQMGFWAMDDIRVCEEEEYRYIESDDEKYSCQKIGVEQTENLEMSENEITGESVDCPEDSFGKFCVPCDIFGKRNCGKFVYCDMMGNSNYECHCTAGYTGSECRACSGKYYGHGCRKECSPHCENGCSWENGICNGESCEVPYDGPMCDKPSEFLFMNPPKVDDIEYTSAAIRVDFMIEGPGEMKRPEFYNIECAEDLDQQESNRTGKKQDQPNWQVIKPKLKLGQDPAKTVIDGLKPDTYYRVRATFKTNTIGNYVKNERFLTHCTEITAENVTIRTTNESATVVIQWPEYHCRFTKYALFRNGSKIMEIKSSGAIELLELQPYTRYIVEISKNHGESHNIVVTKIFWTNEGVPSEVRDIKVNATAYQINLSWEEPEYKRGNIIRYDVEVHLLKSRGPSCPYENRKLVETETKNTYITLEELRPYSSYHVVILAVTNAGKGSRNGTLVDTTQLDQLTNEEKLGIERYNVTSNSVEIVVTKLDCEDLTGSIYIQGTASCTHEWCLGKTVTLDRDYDVDSHAITLTGLFAYSNYTVNLRMSRNKISWVDIGSDNFRTKPSVPNAILHLEAFSKNDASISLRWKKPYPPTGILKEYLILYSKRKDLRETGQKYFSPEPCLLWKDYDCGTLTEDISPRRKYYTAIYARNESPIYYGDQSKIISVEINEEASQPTYNVSLSWDKKNNLTITWYHPNVTNGELSSFEIILKNTEGGREAPASEYVRVTPANYSLTYTKMVSSANLKPCTKFVAYIRVHNIYRKSDFCNSSGTSPPDIPPSIPTKTLEPKCTNSTITIHIPTVGSSTTVFQKDIYVLVSKAAEIDELKHFKTSLEQTGIIPPRLKTSWIVYMSNRTNSSVDIEIGGKKSEFSLENRPLEPGTNYSISVILSNRCCGMTRLSWTHIYISTLEKMGENDGHTGESPRSKDGDGGLWALILLLLAPLIGFGYWYVKNRQPKSSELLIPQERSKQESIALPALPNSGGRVVVVKPKKSLPQILPPLKTTHSKPIRINDFEKYVKQAVESGELERQHSLFPRGLVKPCEYGSLSENKPKNRYKNLIAYDETRVKLQKTRGDEYSDYINANYIDGYRKPRCYIATQGPKNNTLTDFWKMIWQEKVRNIVMLANVFENGKKKVEKYWPDINEDLMFGNVRVQHVSSDIFANFDIRVFNVQCNNQERKVDQLHFTTWPDHGVPLYSQSLVPFLQRLLKIPYNPQSPIVVHCSAGVGRTGTIILSDICLRMAAGEGSIDFLAHLENIRSQRANLVDNVEQYKLVHLVVLECLFRMHTAVPCNEEMKKTVDGILRSNGIRTQMKYIVETQWQDSAMETMLEPEKDFPVYAEKDRFKDIIPRNYRVFLTRYPHDDETSFYINAVLVDGFRNPGRYISTQQPLPNTLGDFWRLVVERSCTTIISLNTLNLKDQTVCKFWPSDDEELIPLDIIRVQHVKTKRLECYKIITVQVILNGEAHFTVDIVEMDNWISNELLPNSIEEFLAFIDAAEAISRNSQSVIVTCFDGATASGLYLAMTFLIEEMKLEQECDVCLAVRTIRHSRKEFVNNEEQYEFLYRASVTFIAGFQSYSNFT